MPDRIAAIAPPAAPAVRDESAARQALRRNRTLANILLAAMAAVFAATFLDESPGYLVALIRAASEAGIVGGLADWFAVTALFRRPLGLPIPHTAVLPRSKDRMARTLASFVEQSFLTEEVLLPRLRAARPAHKVAAWLAEPDNAALVVKPVLEMAPDVLHALDDADLREFLNRVISDELRQIDVAPLAGRTLQILTQSGEADVLFERGAQLALKWLYANQSEIDQLVQEHSRWWIPRAINRRIARQIIEGVTELLADLQDHGSETRRKFKDALASLVARLQNSPEQAGELNAARDRLLAHPDLQAWVNTVWTEISAALAHDLAEPRPRSREILEHAVLSVGRALASDELMQTKIDEGVERTAAHILAYRGDIGAFMAEVVRSWDADTLTERFELVIGSDLQYIRMNGTVVGATVGCGLFVLTHLFS